MIAEDGTLKSRAGTCNRTLNSIPRLEMSLLPTPFHKLHNISKICSSNIYCKRDDLTGFAFGGNKTRKLDFLIADALAKQADSIVAIGANQSNFCRMASAAGMVNGLDVMREKGTYRYPVTNLNTMGEPRMPEKYYELFPEAERSTKTKC